jgi:enoyl-[acyl-carrier protein] reductase I
MVGSLTGKKGLVVGIANEASIAWGCAQAFASQGAELAVTYLNEKAKPYVQPLAHHVAAPIFAPLDVTQPDQMEAVFEAISERWGQLDFLLHSIAFAPKADLHGRLLDSSREGFLSAIDISCHSLIRLARAAEQRIQAGGSILTLSFHGAHRVVPHYQLMGPVKAALESSVRYLAAELGPGQIRINAISPGPISTRAASGLIEFEQLRQQSIARNPLHQAITTEQVGQLAAFLVSDQAQQITGQVLYVDAGDHIMG